MNHPSAARDFLRDPERAAWHDQTLWMVRSKRDRMAARVPEWEQLREAASQIKKHTLAHLADYLEEFADKAEANGIHVHWAADGDEHNRIVHSILKRHHVNKLVKSKSMLTEECHLNPYLQQHGIEVIDTDLGERIVQLQQKSPSHIVMPAIHLKRAEVGEVFHEHLGTSAGLDDAQQLTEAARQHLRSHFLTADAALTGVNFAVAETGGFVVCTNEGNADMGAHLAPVHIACMGIEKIIPKQKDLGVFLRLLARSATGQPSTVFSSHFLKPRLGQEMHLVLVDNGRSRQLARPDFHQSLACIRCAACFNTCPVYRRSGGYSYSYFIAGPIGSILAPNVDKAAHSSMPFASTLCGSCSNVCPVKIDIHTQLLKWRQEISQAGLQPAWKTLSMQVMAWIIQRPLLFRFSGWLARKGLPLANLLKLDPWTQHRDLPEPPQESFRHWYNNQSNKTPVNSENRVNPVPKGPTPTP
ncbi:L-lactate dehydrogenase complex protein LldF [Prosthecobacter debontii]|uniref:L-lactate dehydrogenase complex protein LldF n=1 Tax=Prosthecobacter debontii TaxID=48467 RepID=A0A1T4XTE1_9BACT|nr:lactate utilization protein B [Prosthecobacter debontii]SKA92797.1 L-lactate dehydrogenase complex protein LldF [Prosthecobacter debontii]